jgi:head-tail adaptor
VTADVLARLVAPGRHPKRVSLQYRPFSAAEATRVLESEVNAAQFRAVYKNRTGRDETARDAYDQARARRAAAEEAAGSGVCLVSMYVTVTVASDAELARAAAETEAAAESSRIRLRRMTYAQAAGFAATLPVGICPAELARRMPH